MATPSLKNFYLPTPARIRKIGDSILFFSIAIQPLTLTLPLSDTKRLYVNFGISVAGLIGKFLTNCFTEEPNEFIEPTTTTTNP